MKEIALTNSDQCATVDDEDYEYINQWEWFLVEEENGMEYAARSYTLDDVEYIIYMHDEVWDLNERRK